MILDLQKVHGDTTAVHAAHWLSSAVSDETTVDASELTTENLAELSAMVQADELSSTAAKEVLTEIVANGGSPRAIAEQKNLLQVSDEGAIAAIVDEVLADSANAKAVEDIKAGNERVIGFLVGQVMKKSAGKANPALAQKLLRERI
jgi:aspartyl-tRNA(Asn)/glutamyl-tRNA(Gln) amidotransferase subunit B